MVGAEALAWLARRLVWEDRLGDLEARDGEPTVLPSRRGRRAAGDPGRAHRSRAPLARAS
jgi:hypothetical protein